MWLRPPRLLFLSSTVSEKFGFLCIADMQQKFVEEDPLV